MTQREQILTFVRIWIANQMQQEQKPVVELTLDSALIGESVIDSLGFLELATAVEQQFGCELDFSDGDPEQFTTLGGFVTLCETHRVRRAA